VAARTLPYFIAVATAGHIVTYGPQVATLYIFEDLLTYVASWRNMELEVGACVRARIFKVACRRIVTSTLEKHAFFC
jgi:hypothetical protein